MMAGPTDKTHSLQLADRMKKNQVRMTAAPCVAACVTHDFFMSRTRNSLAPLLAKWLPNASILEAPFCRTRLIFCAMKKGRCAILLNPAAVTSPD
jgi:hypothetical protein